MHLPPGLTRACLNWGVSLVGLDAASVDKPQDDGYPIHRLLLETEVLILEGLSLEGVSPGTYQFICLPLKVA
ncbi:hypothetical protein DFAR_950014 [Desulfarculales bacterium]